MVDGMKYQPWRKIECLLPDPSKPSDDPAIKVGTYIQTQDRFITEYTPEGFYEN
jgi:hypothetical protein